MLDPASLCLLAANGLALCLVKYMDPHRDAERYYRNMERSGLCSHCMFVLCYTVLALSFALNSRFLATALLKRGARMLHAKALTKLHLKR